MELHEHFGTISIPHSLKDDIIENELPQNFLYLTNKVNILIGPNNSGKSLLLRELLKEESITEIFDRDFLLEFNGKLDYYNKQIYTNVFSNYEILRSNELELDKNLVNEALISVTKIQSVRKKINEVEEFFLKCHQTNFHTGINRNNGNSIDSYYSKQFKNLFKELLEDLNLEKGKCLTNGKLNRIYIPTLRTLRVLSEKNVLLNQVNKEYKLDVSHSEKKTKNIIEVNQIQIENGENFFSNALTLRNSDYYNKIKLEKFEMFLSQNFFENQSISIITDASLKVVKIKIGHEKEQPIESLGDGLQMAIILTFPLFNYDNGFVFIEEPELFLHPGFQKKIIALFCNHIESKKFKFFIVTHSNHILDSALQEKTTSIYSVKKLKLKEENKLPKFQLNLLQYGDNNILNELGVANTSLFLSNCTIWVEGITDRIYIKKYIQEYIKSQKFKTKYNRFLHLQEGISYSFILSGGDNIIHHDFNNDLRLEDVGNAIPVKYICNKSLVVVDNDNGKNRVRKNKLKKILGLNFLELPVIEIESLLSPEVIIKTIKQFPSWGQLDQSKIPSFKSSDYKMKRLGSFIDDNLLRKQSIKGKKFKLIRDSSQESNYTLNCKYPFCEKSIEFINEDNLTAEATSVVEQILNFIIRNNP